MNYKKDIRGYLDLSISIENNVGLFSVVFTTPTSCSCGHPHAYIFVNHENSKTMICDFSLETKESFLNFMSVSTTLLMTDFSEQLMECIQSIKNSSTDYCFGHDKQKKIVWWSNPEELSLHL